MTRRLGRRAAAVALAAVTGATSTGCALGGGAGADGERSAFAIVAMALGPRLDVHRTPDGPLAVQLANPNVFHQPLVTLATQRAGDWVKVLLPMRPNGASGWVRLADVRLAWDPWRVVVNLRAHRLVVYDAGHRVLAVPAAVGARSTPTPVGTFYVTSLLTQPDPRGSYGPFAFGLSGYSPVLKTFDGGPGELGLHGTDAQWSLGRPVTHGCVRVDNRVITRLAGRLPLGTPVVVER